MSIRENLEELVPNACALVHLPDLLKVLEIIPGEGGPITSPALTAITKKLSKEGFGWEPDISFSGPAPSTATRVVLFREPISPTGKNLDFILARTEVEICAIFASSDGKIDGEEVQRIVEKIKGMPNLSKPEQVRILAFLTYLVANPPKKKAIDELSTMNIKDREALADAAVNSVTRGKELSGDRVALLKRTYDKLNLPHAILDKKLDAIQSSDGDNQLTQIKVQEPSVGIPIPPKVRIIPTTHVLDQNTISEVRENTERVQKILGAIFTADEEITEEVDASIADAISNTLGSTERFIGLEARHAKLLEEIWDHEVVNLDSFSAAVRKFGLFTSGAIETINDWSFDRFGEPLLEEGPVITVAKHLVESRAD